MDEPTVPAIWGLRASQPVLPGEIGMSDVTKNEEALG
jgi:hypothetical protein